MNIIEVSSGTYHIPPRGYGGAERVAFNISRALLRQGHGGLVLDFNKGWKSKTDRIDGVTIYRVGFPVQIPRQISRLIYMVNAILFSLSLIAHYVKVKQVFPSIDALHFHNPFQSITFRLVRPLLFPRVKLIYTPHSPRWMIPEKFTLLERILARIIELPAMRLADLVTFESPIIQKNVFSLVNLSAQKVLILYNGVDTEEFDPTKYDIEPEPHAILYAARISEQKNQLEILDALPMVISKHPTINFLFVGGVESKEYYQRVAEKVKHLQIEQNVKFLGAVTMESLKKLYARCGIHLIASQYTGFDVTLGESLAFGRALIVSNIPTVREVVTDKEDCLLVDPHDAMGLANGMLTLIEDEALRKRLSANARRLAIQRLDWNKLVKTLVTTLSDIA